MYFWYSLYLVHMTSKVKAPIMDRGPIMDFIFKSYTF
jgi:hypothetical protein